MAFGGLTCLQLITQAEKIQERNGFILYREMPHNPGAPYKLFSMERGALLHSLQNLFFALGIGRKQKQLIAI
jgi:hypothetical protein